MEYNLYNPLATEEVTPECVEKKRVKLNKAKKDIFETMTYIETPISENLQNFIKQEVSEKYDEVFPIIEELCESLVGTELYEKLNERLLPILNDETKKFVGKVLFYRKRPCKKGNNCENMGNCIFIHDISDEVIFNRVPPHIADSRELEKYAQHFGKIKFIKRLNPQKFLFIYETTQGALECIRDKSPVLDDETIKKFFNKKRNDIKDLFKEQDDLFLILFNKGEKKMAIKLKNIQNRMKEAIEINNKK